MSRRLADYFVVVGYDFETQDGFENGQVIQRVPERDWEDMPFCTKLTSFCQPSGWRLVSHPLQTTYHWAHLTNEYGNPYYLAILTFYEKVQSSPLVLDDTIVQSDSGDVTTSFDVYAPKSIILATRCYSPEILKHCLTFIYTLFVQPDFVSERCGENVLIESVLVNILGYNRIPYQSNKVTTVYLTRTYYLNYCPPLSDAIPVTGGKVAALFQLLGIHNVLQLFSAVLTSQKILIISNSYNRLTDACHALVSLIFPFIYTYLYVPILPADMFSVLTIPPAYIMGIHGSCKDLTPDIEMDVVQCDLDLNYVSSSPDQIHIPKKIYQRVLKHLTLVIQPSLQTADEAFPLTPALVEKDNRQKAKERQFKKNSQMLDKQIRAVFLRMFAELLADYRNCLYVIRMFPNLVIKFNSSQFLANRGFLDDRFMTALVDDNMSFRHFIDNRSSPYRSCDIIDTLICNISDVLESEEDNVGNTISNINDLAEKLLENEHVDKSLGNKSFTPIQNTKEEFVNKIFPRINSELVDSLMYAKSADSTLIDVGEKIYNNSDQHKNIVPHKKADRFDTFATNDYILQKRVEVVEKCVNDILENRIADALKTVDSVKVSLKTNFARRTFVQILSKHTERYTSLKLEPQQYRLLLDLISIALLEDGSYCDEHGLVFKLLDAIYILEMRLSPHLCRQMCSDITIPQVFKNINFWKNAFYKKCELQLEKAYHTECTSCDDSLEMAAYKLQQNYTPSQISAYSTQEEGAAQNQLMHYVGVITACLLRRKPYSLDYVSNRAGAHSSTGYSESVDVQHDSTNIEPSDEVQKFVSRFVDTVAAEAEISSNLMRSVYSHFYITLETLDEQMRHVEKASATQNVTETISFSFAKPFLISGEEFKEPSLKAFMLENAKLQSYDKEISSKELIHFLPAEGTLWLTNYRVIFTGRPLSVALFDYPICYSFPISSVIKEKKLNSNFSLNRDDVDLPLKLNTYQYRTTNLQIFVVGFPIETLPMQIEDFRNAFYALRHPIHLNQTFALNPSAQELTNITKNKGKSKTKIRNLMQSAKKLTYRSGKSKSNQIGSLSTFDENSEDEDSLQTITQMNQVNTDKLRETLYWKDYNRMGFGSQSPQKQKSLESFMISTVNCNYGIIPSYPAGLIVPSATVEKTLQSVSMFYRCNRLPVPVFRHPSTKALLIRSAGFHTRGIMSIIKQHGSPQSADTSEGSFNILDHTSFLGFFTTTSRKFLRRTHGLSAIFNSESQVSLIEIFSASTPPMVQSNESSNLDSPSLSPKRSTNFGKQIRKSGRKFLQPLRGGLSTFDQKGASLKRAGTGISPNKGTKSPSMSMHLGIKRSTIINGAIDEEDNQSITSSLGSHSLCSTAPSSYPNLNCRACLYVFGDKAQLKNIKHEMFNLVDFIPLEYPDIRSIRNSFRLFSNVIAPNEHISDSNFYRLVHESKWMDYISFLLNTASSAVELMESFSASVQIALEDGCDCTTQIVSLIEILIDPFYRTIDGFITLIEKEWIAFGHRFKSRSNQLSGSEFVPVFLLFLDAVYQILIQFPTAFEFNNFFLKTIAHHYSSNRFRNFLGNSEFERSSLFIEDHYQNTSLKHGQKFDDGFSFIGKPRSSDSLWDKIKLFHSRSPRFYNYWYVPSVRFECKALAPYCGMSHLELWDFYNDDNLNNSDQFDFDLFSQTGTIDSDEPIKCDNPIENLSSSVLIADYHPQRAFDKNFFDATFEQLLDAQKPWYEIWSDIGNYVSVDIDVKLTWPELFTLNNNTVLSTRRRKMFELLMPGRFLTDVATRLLTVPHRMEPYIEKLLCTSYCAHCKLAIGRSHGTLADCYCTECDVRCHSECVASLAKVCKHPDSISITNRRSSTVVSPLDKIPMKDSLNNSPKNEIISGLLHKRGKVLKQWSLKHAVLDGVRHQLRFYNCDSLPQIQTDASVDNTAFDPDNEHCKILDLKDVECATICEKLPGLPKRFENMHGFEIKTNRRSYCLLAESDAAARDWVEKISSQLY